MNLIPYMFVYICLNNKKGFKFQQPKKTPNITQTKVSRYLVLSKMAVRHSVHIKKSLKFGLSKTSMSTFDPCQMVLDRRKYQGPFDMDQMS